MTKMSQKTVANHGDWMKIMQEGQLTRDPCLKTRDEIERDRAQAEALQTMRRNLFFDLNKKNKEE